MGLGSLRATPLRKPSRNRRSVAGQGVARSNKRLDLTVGRRALVLRCGLSARPPAGQPQRELCWEAYQSVYFDIRGVLWIGESTSQPIPTFATARHYSGIIVLRLANQAKPHVLSILARLLDSLRRKSPSGHLWIADEYRIRIRPGSE